MRKLCILEENVFWIRSSDVEDMILKMSGKNLGWVWNEKPHGGFQSVPSNLL